MAFSHKCMQLSRGVYTINVVVNERFNYNAVYRINNVVQLVVHSETESFPPFLLRTNLIHIENE